MNQSPRRLIGLAAVIGSVLVLGACKSQVSIGEKTIDQDELELSSSRTLQKEYGERPTSIDCPEDLKAETGATETCELVDKRGNRYDMQVTVTSVDDDGNAKFNIKVGNAKQTDAVPE